MPTIPLFVLGAVIAMSRNISEAPALLTAVAAGGVASVLALLALTVDESDEAFANVYSGAVSLQNLMPRVPQRLLVGAVAAVSTVGALVIDLRNYQPFLYLLGSFFVPLFAVLLADWLLAGRRYVADDIFRGARAARRDASRLARGLLPLPVALARRRLPRLVDPRRRPRPSARPAVGRRVAAELRGRLRARRARTNPRKEAYPRERVIALLGNLAKDLLPGGPRVGGGAYHGARALQRLRVPARIVTRCADEDHDELLPPLVRLGTPVRFVPGRATAAFSFTYDGDRRTMTLEGLGDVWAPSDVPELRARWLHIAPLSRVEWPTATVAALARRHRVSFDGQGLVRVPEIGPLRLDDNFDRDILRHIWVLKLADEEAEVLGDVAALGVREVLVTHGSRGSTVYCGGTSGARPRAPRRRRPDGSGDAFATAYIVGRNAGLGPTGAARRATAVVASLLGR